MLTEVRKMRVWMQRVHKKSYMGYIYYNSCSLVHVWCPSLIHNVFQWRCTWTNSTAVHEKGSRDGEKKIYIQVMQHGVKVARVWLETLSGARLGVSAPLRTSPYTLKSHLPAHTWTRPYLKNKTLRFTHRFGVVFRCFLRFKQQQERLCLCSLSFAPLRGYAFIVSGARARTCACRRVNDDARERQKINK